MIDQNLVRLVVEAGQIEPGDLVIEVGPGTGTLTEELLARGPGVLAVEIDRDLAGLLRERFAANPAFRLIEADALAGKHQLNSELRQAIASAAGPVKLVANLPYNIASPLVIELLIAGVQRLAFTVQKEVADRLRAGAGEDAYGPLSVMAGLLAEVQVLRTLPPQAFWPAPKIESALVQMIRHDRLAGRAGPFGAFMHGIFAYRRKTLRQAIIRAGHEPQRLLDAAGLDPRQRPEQVAPGQYLAMFEALP
jgi:16S rRNA (adenine1518-N6/adenine1519-N6)-dimethyltransferase